MFHSSLSKLVAAVSSLAACGVVLAAIPKPACAVEAEQGVCRTFIVLVNTLDEAPGLQSEQSLGLVVAPAEPTRANTIYFGASACSDELGSSIWENATLWEQQGVIHITKDGAELYGNVFWLLTPETPEPPPVGAITFTGPDSPLILNQETFYYEAYGIGYQIRCPSNGPGGAGLLLVVTVVLSR